MKDWWELMRRRRHRDDTPMKPQVVARALNELPRRDAIITTDSGTITTWIARNFRIKRRQMFSCSGNLATMAPGLPYAIGAQVAYPDRQVVAFVGDGGFTMLMGELLTAVKYNLPIKVIIIKNNYARPDQVGADRLPRQPRVRRGAAADRLRELGRGGGRRGFRVRGAGADPTR